MTENQTNKTADQAPNGSGNTGSRVLAIAHTGNQQLLIPSECDCMWDPVYWRQQSQRDDVIIMGAAIVNSTLAQQGALPHVRESCEIKNPFRINGTGMVIVSHVRECYTRMQSLQARPFSS